MGSRRLTLTEALLSRKLGRVPAPGEHVVVDVDLVYMHDGTFPLALEVLRRLDMEKVFDPRRIVLFIDHAAPAPNPAAAIAHRIMREFSRKHGVKLYDVGVGISHQVVIDEGLIEPGNVIAGADSHTVTLGALATLATGFGSTDTALAMATGKTWLRVPEQVKVSIEGKPSWWVMGKDIALALLGKLGSDGAVYSSLEFQGSALPYISMDSRITISNMSVEVGAKYGLFPVDGLAKAWYGSRGISTGPLEPGSKATYSDEIVMEASRLEPMIAAPPSPDNVASVAEHEGVEVDQVFIGSCTNGRLEDFHAAARVLKRHSVKQGVRCIAVPASRRIYMRLLREGIIEALTGAGCVVAHSTCGPCIGAHLGLLAEGEVAISTSNRNMPGRMGHKSARIYLANPATAAAAAVTGRIVDPRELLPPGSRLMDPVEVQIA
ncbi:MAG: 3-isopropylmalate dehydratase large subunit [Desulfurococcales archaeon]|nr:3-isopropylmalate dehydratase large subunit [Desulfurococcales archaeon]